MSVKLLAQLRLLNPTLPLTNFPRTKFGSYISLSRTVPIISRIFFFKLKYHGLARNRFLKTEQFGLQNYSTRPFRERTGSGVSEFRRDGEKGGVRASKSLVEDEAELSDWVGELRSGSFRGGLYSEDESDEERGRSVRHGDRGKETVPIEKRRKDFESDEFDGDVGRRGSRGMQFGCNGDRGKETVRIKKRRSNFDSDEFDGDVRRRGSRGMQFGRNGDRVDNELRKSGNESRKARILVDDEDEDEDEEEARFGFPGLVGDNDEDKASEDESDELEDEISTKVIPNSLPEKSDSYLSETRFDQVPISPLSLKGIKDAGYEKMTVVQEATLSLILKGKDVLAKAKTGTGKTVAFLLPSIEVVTKSPPISRDQKRPPIFVLVICPTRELANQAAAEANTLLKYHPSIGVQVVMGGTRLALEQKRIQANPCQILVATPGRLKDHMENTAGFATRLMGVKVLVLDEADHLLDMGFRKDIEKIIAAVPKQRQTLLFSATVPEEVRQISLIALKRDYEFINTVQEGSVETHSQVRQSHLVAPLDEHFSLLYVTLKEHIADDVDYKVIVFCTTAMITRLVAGILGELNLNVREIHSRKPQSYRTRISDEFRKSKGLILVTSDVSARGVDYPDVTLVIQMGLPSDREQYIHRLGRTGRKGKEGQGMLLLAPWEAFFLSEIKNLPITKSAVPSMDQDIKRKVERALSQVEMKNKEAAYQSWLGYYNSQKKVGRDKCKLVELANEFSRSMGLDNPPAIPKLVLGKMGLRNIPGLRSK